MGKDRVANVCMRNYNRLRRKYQRVIRPVRHDISQVEANESVTIEIEHCASELDVGNNSMIVNEVDSSSDEDVQELDYETAHHPQDVDDIGQWNDVIASVKTQDEMKEAIATWSIEFNIRSRAMSALLSILCKALPFLPKDPKTLRQTMKRVEVKEIAGGKYVYQGVRQGLERYVQAYTDTLDTLHININVDGIPLFKSNGIQLWPILASVNASSPFAIAHWLGSSNPNDVTSFLSDFVEEVKDLQVNDFMYAGHRY